MGKELKNESRHVIPNKDGGWSVRKPGSSRSSRVFNTKKEAVDYARSQVKTDGSEIYVHKKDGSISEKRSVYSDPFKKKTKK